VPSMQIQERLYVRSLYKVALSLGGTVSGTRVR
jgi:hypothetical protein